jgi:hypothetical protein
MVGKRKNVVIPFTVNQAKRGISLYPEPRKTGFLALLGMTPQLVVA